MPVPRNRAGILHARLQQLGTLENAHTFNSSKPSFCSHFNSSLIKITQFVHPYYKMSTIKLSNFRMNIRQALKKPFTTTKWQKGRTTQQLCPVALPACLSPPYCLKWFFFVCFLLVLFFLCSVLSYRSRCKQSMSAGSQRVYRGLSDCFGHAQHFHHGFQGIKNDKLL